MLLDAATTGLDAASAVRAFRARSALPLVVISLLTRAADPVATLESGADDYVRGPLDPEEVVARVRAVLRRHSETRVESGIVEAGGVWLDRASRAVRSRANRSSSRRWSSTCWSTSSATPAGRCCATI